MTIYIGTLYGRLPMAKLLFRWLTLLISFVLTQKECRTGHTQRNSTQCHTKHLFLLRWLQAAIGHVRYINTYMLTWLRGFQDKILYLMVFSLYPSLFWELRDKRNFNKLQFCPESLGAMLEY